MQRIVSVLKETLARSGMSAAELSKRSGVHEMAVLRLRGNKAKQIDLSVLERIADTLGVSPLALLTVEGADRPCLPTPLEVCALWGRCEAASWDLARMSQDDRDTRGAMRQAVKDGTVRIQTLPASVRGVWREITLPIVEADAGGQVD